ncbi:hypothetical protein HMPREF1985_00207 [Mitsuokella sp. oral taxon 131 str. W9106]|nr:hypothetical protein HMPREF1985_00207 [Mitsuokella sp. oral taxon 131 str. W9106]
MLFFVFREKELEADLGLIRRQIPLVLTGSSFRTPIVAHAAVHSQTTSH